MWVVHHINCIALHEVDLGYDFIPIDSIELDWTSVFSFLPSKMSYYKNVFLAFTMINLEEEVWVTFKLVIRKVNGSFLRSFEWHVWTNGVSASKHTIWKNCVSCAIQLNHVSLLDVISYPIATSLISFQYPFHCMFPNWNWL